MSIELIKRSFHSTPTRNIDAGTRKERNPNLLRRRANPIPKLSSAKSDEEDFFETFMPTFTYSEPTSSETQESELKHGTKKTNENPKQFVQIAVTVFCMLGAGFFFLQSFLQNSNPVDATAAVYDDVRARAFLEGYNNEKLSERLNAAIWSEQFNKEQARYHFRRLRYEAHETFKDELSTSDPNRQIEKAKICQFFNYLETKINPPKDEK